MKTPRSIEETLKPIEKVPLLDEVDRALATVIQDKLFGLKKTGHRKVPGVMSPSMVYDWCHRHAVLGAVDEMLGVEPEETDKIKTLENYAINHQTFATIFERSFRLYSAERNFGPHTIKGLSVPLRCSPDGIADFAAHENLNTALGDRKRFLSLIEFKSTQIKDYLISPPEEYLHQCALYTVCVNAEYRELQAMTLAGAVLRGDLKEAEALKWMDVHPLDTQTAFKEVAQRVYNLSKVYRGEDPDPETIRRYETLRERAIEMNLMPGEWNPEDLVRKGILDATTLIIFDRFDPQSYAVWTIDVRSPDYMNVVTDALNIAEERIARPIDHVMRALRSGENAITYLPPVLSPGNGLCYECEYRGFCHGYSLKLLDGDIDHVPDEISRKFRALIGLSERIKTLQKEHDAIKEELFGWLQESGVSRVRFEDGHAMTLRTYTQFKPAENFHQELPPEIMRDLADRGVLRFSIWSSKIHDDVASVIEDLKQKGLIEEKVVHRLYID